MGGGRGGRAVANTITCDERLCCDDGGAVVGAYFGHACDGDLLLVEVDTDRVDYTGEGGLNCATHKPTREGVYAPLQRNRKRGAACDVDIGAHAW